MRVHRRPHRSWRPWLLALEAADVGFEAITLPHLDGEMVVVPFSFPTSCVLGEERFGHLLGVVERMWR